MIDPFNKIKVDLISKFGNKYNPDSSSFPRIEVYEGTSTLGNDKGRDNVTQVYCDIITNGRDEFEVNELATFVRTEIEEGTFSLSGLDFNGVNLISNQYSHESTDTENIHRKVLIYNFLTTEI